MKDIKHKSCCPTSSFLPLYHFFSAEKTGHSTSSSKYDEPAGRWKVIPSQAIPRIRARMLEPVPGVQHLHTPQQRPLRSICQTKLGSCCPPMRRAVCPSPGGKKLQIWAALTGHFKGWSASTEKSSIKTVQRRESKSAVL